jgi:hypothetical protein
MPKHDEPITMADYDAREKAEHLARLTTGDEGNARREEAERRALEDLKRPSSFWRVINFNDEDKAADKAAIFQTMLCSDERKQGWILDIERAVNSYIHDDSRLVRKVRARMEQLSEAVKPLAEFFGCQRTSDDRKINREVFKFLQTIDAEFDDARRAIFQEMFGNINNGVKFDGAIIYLAFILERGLAALPKSGRGAVPDTAADGLASRLAGLWIENTGSTPINSTDTELGEMQGAFADHMRKIVLAIPEEHRPDSEDGFIRRAFKQ